MDKKEYLSQYKYVQQEFDRLLDERAKWIGRATKMTPTYTGMPHGGDGEDRMQEAIEQVFEVEEQIFDKAKELSKLRDQIESSIRTVGNYKLESVLRYKYIDDLTLSQIASKMNYCYKQVKRYHKEALKKMSPNVPF